MFKTLDIFIFLMWRYAFQGRKASWTSWIL